MSRGPEPAGRSGIGSSNSRFQPRSVTGLDRLAQPLHGEFDVLRLQLAPALDLSLVMVLGEALEVFRGQPPGCRALLGKYPQTIIFLRRPEFPSQCCYFPFAFILNRELPSEIRRAWARALTADTVRPRRSIP